MAKASSRPWISSTVTGAAGSSSARNAVHEPIEPDAARRLDQDHVTVAKPRRQGRQGGLERPATASSCTGSSPASSAPSAMAAASRPTTTSQSTIRAAASPTARWPSSLASPSSSISPRIATAPTGQPGQQVERGDHGPGRGVVGVVDQGHAAGSDDSGPVWRGPPVRQPGGDLVEGQPGGKSDRGGRQGVVDR